MEPGLTVGNAILSAFHFPTSHSHHWIWGGVGFLWGLLLILTELASIALRFASVPSRQPSGGSAAVQEAAQQTVQRWQRCVCSNSPPTPTCSASTR